MSPKYIKIEKKLLFYSISQYYFFDQTNGILVTPMIFLPIKRKKKKKKKNIPEAVTPVRCHVYMVKYLISKLVNVLHTYKTKLPHTSFSWASWEMPSVRVVKSWHNLLLISTSGSWEIQLGRTWQIVQALAHPSISPVDPNNTHHELHWF